MQKLKAYSVFDIKAAVYGTPFFMGNDRIASRAFADLVNDQSTMANKHPGDFVLYSIGYFNDETGVLETEKPAVIVTAAACVELSKPNNYFLPDAAKAAGNSKPVEVI